MMKHEMIYQSEAERYDRLVSNEDRGAHLLKAIQVILPDLTRLNAADIGAGTGRLTRLLAPNVKTIQAFDASTSMLNVAAKHLSASGLTNWSIAQGANDELPLKDNAVDLLTAGWTICYSASVNVPNWEGNLRAIMNELSRVVRPGGTAILFENFGTGSEVPSPPDCLTPYYRLLESHYDFEHTHIRTDFEFATLEEGAALIEFFFGCELSNKFVHAQSTILPACTGIWWKKF